MPLGIWDPHHLHTMALLHSVHAWRLSCHTAELGNIRGEVVARDSALAAAEAEIAALRAALAEAQKAQGAQDEVAR